MDHYSFSLSLCHAHVALWSWWKLVFDALAGDSEEQLLRLLEFTLICTVQLRVVSSEVTTITRQHPWAAPSHLMPVVHFDYIAICRWLFTH